MRRFWLGGLVAVSLFAVDAAPGSAAGRFLQPPSCFSHTTVAGCTPLAGIDGPARSAIAPDGRQLYLPARETDTLWIFDRDPATGELTRRSQCFGPPAAGCTAVPLLDGPSAVAVSPDGRNVFVVTAESGSSKEDGLLVFARLADGALAYVSCISQGTSCGGSARPSLDSNSQVIATDNGVIVAAFGGNAVTSFARNGSSLTFVNCISDGVAGCASANGRLSAPTDLALTPNGQWLVVTSYDQPSRVHVVSRASNGELAARSDSASCAAPSGTANCTAAPATAETTGSAMSADGTHVYTSSRYTFGGGEAVQLFDVNQSTGSLTWRAGGCWTAPEWTVAGCTKVTGLEGLNDVALTADGSRVYAAGLDDGGHVVAFDRAADGNLTPQPLPDGCYSGGGTSGCAALTGGSAMVFFLTASPDSTTLYASGEPNGSDATRLWTFGLDRPPVCQDAAAAIGHNSTTAVALTCSDPDGDAITIAVASHPAHGSLGAVQPGGLVSYTPVTGFSGADSFTFSAISRGLGSGVATATLSVAAAAAPAGPGAASPPPPAPVRIRTRISSRFRTLGKVTRVLRLVVTGIPAGARVGVVCTARRTRGACPFTRKRGTVSRGRSVLTRLFMGKVLRAGAVLEIRITAPGRIGQATRYTVRPKRRPRTTTLCIQPGARSATRC